MERRSDSVGPADTVPSLPSDATLRRALLALAIEIWEQVPAALPHTLPSIRQRLPLTEKAPDLLFDHESRPD